MNAPLDLPGMTLDEIARLVFAHESRDDIDSIALVEACRAEVRQRRAACVPSEVR